jgi:hypothetical protein
MNCLICQIGTMWKKAIVNIVKMETTMVAPLIFTSKSGI